MLPRLVACVPLCERHQGLCITDAPGTRQQRWQAANCRAIDRGEWVVTQRWERGVARWICRGEGMYMSATTIKVPSRKCFQLVSPHSFLWHASSTIASPMRTPWPIHTSV